MTAQGCERFEDLCLLTAAGSATPDEERALSAHLVEGCAACEGAQRELGETAARLAQALPPIAPPPLVKDRLMEAIGREKGVRPFRSLVAPVIPSRIIPRLAWPWAAGWGFAAVLGILLVWNSDVHRKVVARQTAELETLHLALAQKEEALRLIEAKHTQTVRLTGLDPSPKAFGRIFWNPEANAGLLFAFDLPPLPEGKVYQLWAIQGAAPVDAGIFTPDQRGVGSLRVKALPEPAKTVGVFAITIEPAGGSRQPTGSMYLKGSSVLL
ncbi:MAG: anti-sigma factor [Nitrospirae bacterium]|nr:anti-sigma factor [Nitrospirota bacterium]